MSEELPPWELGSGGGGTGFKSPARSAATESPPFSSAALTPNVFSAVGGEDFFSLTGVEDTDLAEDELSDLPLLDSDLDLDLDLFTSAEPDLDFDLLLLLGDLDLFLPACGDRCLRDNERDLDLFPARGGERFLLPGERERLLTGDRDLERLRDGGVLDLVRLWRLLDLERRLRFSTTMERDRVRLLLRSDRDRERRDLGDLRRLDKDRLLERRPPARLPSDRDLERPIGRRDLE